MRTESQTPRLEAGCPGLVVVAESLIDTTGSSRRVRVRAGETVFADWQELARLSSGLDGVNEARSGRLHGEPGEQEEGHGSNGRHSRESFGSDQRVIHGFSPWGLISGLFKFPIELSFSDSSHRRP